MMRMWRLLAREFKWFLSALVLSAPLSLLFWLLNRTIVTADGVPVPLSIRLFLIGWGVMFVCMYVGRVTVRFMRDRFLDPEP